MNCQNTPLTREQIRAVFLEHGFTIKEGHDDLKPYVYEAAEALLMAGRVEELKAFAARIEGLEQRQADLQRRIFENYGTMWDRFIEHLKARNGYEEVKSLIGGVDGFKKSFIEAQKVKEQGTT